MSIEEENERLKDVLRRMVKYGHLLDEYICSTKHDGDDAGYDEVCRECSRAWKDAEDIIGDNG